MLSFCTVTVSSYKLYALGLVTDTEVLFLFVFFPETFNLARKAAIIAAEDQPIDSNIETDYEKPRKRQLPARFIQSSDDENSEKENKCIKRKRTVAAKFRREMQYIDNEESEDVSQVNNIPAPATNIREQLAALKAQISHSKSLEFNESHLKKKVVKKLIKTNKNDRMSPKKSTLKSNKSFSIKTHNCTYLCHICIFVYASQLCCYRNCQL